MFRETTIHEGSFRAEQAKSYVHLPFAVPFGAQRLEVHYQYSDRIGSDPRPDGGNTIDLGLFDARGIDFLNAGFRGWSGSERPGFVIGRREASPGYLAGPLPPGLWHVLLGLYKIAANGCDYRVTITVDSQPAAGAAPTTEMPSARPVLTRSGPGNGWLKGELHCHSWHSDGESSPADLVRMAHGRGLQFLALTEHNTTASWPDLAAIEEPGLVLISGLEVTTFAGHFNVWGSRDWVDFRVEDAGQMAAALRSAQEMGGLTSCNHPKPFGPPWDYPDVANYDLVEVWNGPWGEANQAALDFWVTQLERGRRISAIGGSDYHRRGAASDAHERALGTPVVWAWVPGVADAGAILDAIRAGHTSLSDEPDGPFLALEAGPDHAAMAGDAINVDGSGELEFRVSCLRSAATRLILLDQRGPRWERELPDAEAQVSVRLAAGNSRYVRAELRGSDGSLRALTNPLYLSP